MGAGFARLRGRAALCDSHMERSAPAAHGSGASFLCAPQGFPSLRDGASAPAATLRMFDARHGTAGRAHLRAQMQRARWSAGARHGRGGDSGRVCSSPPPPLPASCAFRVGTWQRHGSAGERRSGGGGSEGARATHPALGRRGLEPARQGGRRLTDRLRGERHGCLRGALRDRAVAPPPPCAHARARGGRKIRSTKTVTSHMFCPHSPFR